MRTSNVGRTPWSARVPLDPLFRARPNRPAGGPAADQGVRPTTRGGALLAVLWLSAALAAIAFSISTTVRGETERTSTAVDDLRSYYLATGAIERAILDMQFTRDYHPGQARFSFHFETGEATVDIIPESARLNINQAPADLLYPLLVALGAGEDRAREVTAAILDWRTAAGPGGGIFDGFYAQQNPSFSARHASFQETEELLSVKGVTPDLYYGTYVRDTSINPPQLVARGGLKDCVSVYGTGGAVDINGAAPAVMAAFGIPRSAIDEIVARRPFLKPEDYAAFAQSNPQFSRLRLGGNTMFTLRATARLRKPDGNLSDLRRTVSAAIAFQFKTDPPVVVMRWYDRG